MKVLIISGGNSSERKVSLTSAKFVKEAIIQNGYKVKVFDLLNGYNKLKKLLKDFDVIFPVLHGEEGEGGELQKFLLKSGKPFIGGDPNGFKEGWFKISFKKFCDKNKINTSPWETVKSIEDIKKFGFPSVLKSSNGGSSREVIILRTSNDLKNSSVMKLLNSSLKLFVEKFLPGVEITVGILNDRALPVLEIVPPEGKWFDYKNKYSGATKEIPDAPSISNEIRRESQKIALMIHQKLKLGQYSRIDFIVSDNIPYVLEVNTIPGLTDQSLFPKAAQTAGITFPNLIKKLISNPHSPIL